VESLAARSLRVTLLTSARSWRGSTQVFAVIARGLAARGHTTIALVANEEVAGGFQAQRLRAMRLPVSHTGLTGARALRRVLRDFGPHLLLVDKARDIRLAALASVGLRLSVVYCMSTPHPPGDVLTRLAFRRVRQTVFLTEQFARRALAEAPFLRRVPYRVIPNGVDCGVFVPAEAAGRAFRQRHDLGDGPVLVGVGALAPEKRWELLLDSLALLSPPAPPLVLCGAGPLEDALRAQAQRLDLDVRLLGQMEPGDLVGAYNAATCVVHTCPEVFSLAVTEALACGRPVLAVDGGGTPEVVHDAGVVAPGENPAAFARLLQELLGDAARRQALGAAARQRAVERYSVERMVAAYGDLLESLA
jgi:glycosyltransferase involved in cell wall biosynthesis